MSTTYPVDLSRADQQALAARIGQSWRELRRGAAMSAVRDHLFGELELGQVDALDLLVQRTEWRMSELAEALRVDPSTATRTVQRLERDGLAERCPCRDDGRVVKVSVTPEGGRRHDAVMAARRGFYSSILTAFDPLEREALADLLERLVGAVDRFVAVFEPAD